MPAKATVKKDTVFFRLTDDGKIEYRNVAKDTQVTIVYDIPNEYTLVKLKAKTWSAYDNVLKAN